ncbi:MAG TPA: potassium-transporting ATPase subunit F [Thermoplasmata archaeon]|nr:potassium-transporting ATPase subunit F [Thermoplasmata archaeon]
MPLLDSIVQNLGLVVFTGLSVAIIVYLLYAMINPTRF